MSLLELKDVSKVYGDLHALDHANLTVDKGEWIAIMGPSGSGKSTMMNIISCMDRPSSGKVIFDGKDITKESRRKLTEFHRDKIGLVFQQFHLINYLSAVENVMVAKEAVEMILNGSRHKSVYAFLENKKNERKMKEFKEVVGIERDEIQFRDDLD